MNPVGTYNGLPVYLSVLCIRKVPARAHKERMRAFNFDCGGMPLSGTAPAPGGYHKRVQKKWNKRYGFKDAFCAYVTPDAIYMHPEQWARIKVALKPFLIVDDML